MATFSHSPHMRALDPSTPIHSPHHSLHSSASSRLSVRNNLTLHEYRKQQNSPASLATPPGKTLRRKPAAAGLKEIESVPSLSRTPLSSSRVDLRPLRVSQSNHSLYTYQQLPPSPPHQQQDLPVDDLFRSQSADPSAHYSATGKVREFKPIKRLPKPQPASRGPFPIAPAPIAAATSSQSRLSPLRTTSFPSFDNNPASNDTLNTPSSFSLSRFPRPPNLADTSLSPLSDENAPPHVNTISFASTAPATPPATPAVIHYRGASFDLVNPHHSLVLENIVTPSRDIDSSDYLPLRTSDDLLASSEMAPKRALYGDLNAAYASIISRRGDEGLPPLQLNMPLPPTPVAQSPMSSAFDSPLQSPQSNATDSPFTDRKPANESRFSLKQITRSFTRRFSKTPERAREEELQEFSDSRVSLASASFDGEFPRPLERSYRGMTPRSPTFTDEPPTPVSPLDRAVHVMLQSSSPPLAEQSRHSAQRIFSAPLASMVPDDPSIELGRAGDERRYVSDSDFTTKPYYDDLGSIYPSSSVYTSESRRHSKYEQRDSGNRKSNLSWATRGAAGALAEEYKSDAIDYSILSRRSSKPLEQAMFHRSLQLEGEKTDTISKFIDQYESVDGSNASQPLLSEPKSKNVGFQEPSSDVYQDAAARRYTSQLAPFDFDLSPSEDSSKEEIPLLPPGTGETGKTMLAPPPGLPPSMPAPLAPAFEYDDTFESPKRSEISSRSPSYGDTRQLLQFSQPIIEQAGPIQVVPEVSSSYSQPAVSPNGTTPQKALDQAEEIFAQAARQRPEQSIPTMWSKRVSNHNLLRNKSNNGLDIQEKVEEQDSSFNAATYEEEEDVDWETVGNHSPSRGIRVSIGESIADYSSSDGTRSSRDSLGFSGPFPVYEEPPSPMPPGSCIYQHPTPLRCHSNPFTSSPPPLSNHGSRSGIILGSSPPVASTAPELRGRSQEMYGSPRAGRSPETNGSPNSPRQEYIPFTPWVSPYALSDKETQELLASGPNEEILYDVPEEDEEHGSYDYQIESSSPMQPMQLNMPTATTMDGGNDSNVPRENSFEKFTIVGPRGNLTGTPHGTGMHDAGSSTADNSSPGAPLDSSPLAYHSGEHTGFQIFRSAAARNTNTHAGATQYCRKDSGSSVGSDSREFYNVAGSTGSVNRIAPRMRAPSDLEDRSPSQATIYPQESPFADPDRRSKRLSVRIPITPRDPRRKVSRPAVPGQTKLRQMVLASVPNLSSSDRSVNENDSRFFGTDSSDVRPSTSNTHTPLRTFASRPNIRVELANEHSPHLLCPERAVDPQEEEARRKLSWIIFAVFCLLPPTLILFRWMGDLVIVNVTKGRFLHASSKPKQVALVAGIVVNIGIIAGILLPILIAHASGSL